MEYFDFDDPKQQHSMADDQVYFTTEDHSLRQFCSGEEN